LKNQKDNSQEAEEMGGYLSSLRMARRATVGTPWVMVPVLSNTTEHTTIIGYKYTEIGRQIDR
jgi:hypothetical protein